MPYITKIRQEAEFNDAFQSFKTVCTANVAALGLTPGSLSVITTAATDLATAMTDYAAAKAAAEAAISAKNAKLAAAHAVVSQYSKQFRANLAIPDSLLNSLMLAPHDTPGSKTTPTIPMNLVANADGLGNVRLEWKRNGNIPGTNFIVERRDSPTGAWSYLATSTKRSLDTTWTVGSYVAYRVKAERRGISSSYGVAVSLWPSAPEVELAVAA